MLVDRLMHNYRQLLTTWNRFWLCNWFRRQSLSAFVPIMAENSKSSWLVKSPNPMKWDRCVDILRQSMSFLFNIRIAHTDMLGNCSLQPATLTRRSAAVRIDGALSPKQQTFSQIWEIESCHSSGRLAQIICLHFGMCFFLPLHYFAEPGFW